MAETPRLYLPKWSDEIMAEVSRNLLTKWNRTAQQIQRREDALRAHFPEAWIEGHAPLIPVMTNDEKDRHVIAAAVSSGTPLIVTYNLKNFPVNSLDRWGIERQGPSTFFTHLYDLEPGIARKKWTEQEHNIGISIQDLLRKLQINPTFRTFESAIFVHR